MLLYKEGQHYILDCAREQAFIPKTAGFTWFRPVRHKWSTKNSVLASFLVRYANTELQKELIPVSLSLERNLLASKARTSKKDYPSPDDLEYLPFQKAGIEFTLANKRVLLADEMGLGKTIQTIGVINELNVSPILIVCPASLKLNWLQELDKWLTIDISKSVSYSTKLDLSTDVVIVNYDCLKKFIDKLKTIEWAIVIGDECFPYDTPIITDQGVLSIGDIVENKRELSVLSCNSLSHGLEWRKIEGYMKYPSTRRMVKVTHEQGSFTCTGNHQIWTNTGPQKAGTLTRNSYLRIMPEYFLDPHQGQDNGQVLFQKLRGNPYQSTCRCEEQNKPEIKQAISWQSLWMVWKRFQNKIVWPNKRNKKVLQHKLCCRMEDVSTKKAESTEHSHDWSRRLEQGTQKSRYFHQNETTNERSNGTQKVNGRILQVAKTVSNILTSWWKTVYYKAATNLSRSAWVDKVHGIQYLHWWSKAFSEESTNVLLAGHCYTTSQNRHRGRRKFAYNEKVEKDRPPQESNIEWSRVVGVEILEQRDINQPGQSGGQDQSIYDIEVGGNHNYFANGVLVSNSTAIKSNKAQRTRAFMKLDAEYKILLTGTPILNRPEEIFTSLKWLDHEVWGNWHNFVTQYCGAKKTNWGYDTTGASNLEELSLKLRSTVMIRRLKSEVMPDLPPKFRQIIKLPCENLNLIKSEVEAWKDARIYEAQLKRLLRKCRRSKNPQDFADEIKELRELVFCKFGELSKLRHDTAVFKVPMAIAHLKHAVESGPVVCFAHHRDVVEKINEAFPDVSVKLYGGMNEGAKNESVNTFQKDDNCRLLVTGIKAGGIGLTLTRSSHVVFCEMDWTPATLTQAEDRCHRHGQKDNVLVQHLVIDGSVDAMMAKRCIVKQEVIDKVMK